jgi:hypothetical protein
VPSEIHRNAVFPGPDAAGKPEVVAAAVGIAHGGAAFRHRSAPGVLQLAGDGRHDHLDVIAGPGVAGVPQGFQDQGDDDAGQDGHHADGHRGLHQGETV